AASTAFVGTLNDRFVAQAYQAILGRDVDPTGLAFWTRLLNQGQLNRTQAIQAILGSLEYRAKVVTDLYHSLLRRNPDAFGLATFVNFLGSGGTIAQVQALILGSGEYFVTQGGGTVNGFLAALYRDVLGRQIDPNGQATWTFLL